MDGLRAAITVVPGVVDEELAERTTIGLRAELAEAGFAVTRKSDPEAPPPGAKSGPLVVGGQLVVTGLASAATLRALVSLVREWAGRHRHHSVRVEVDGRSLEIHGYSPESTERLVRILSGTDDGH